ncbi:hypothetical protein P8452_02516 [Trifolium repens]|nr:hypothetical protein P8452_02516 [Trifolium repens]
MALCQEHDLKHSIMATHTCNGNNLISWKDPWCGGGPMHCIKESTSGKYKRRHVASEAQLEYKPRKTNATTNARMSP